jgi:hypothetical protein
MVMRNGPERIGDILSSVFVRRGLGQQQGMAVYQQAWAAAAGPALSQYTSIKGIHAGRLEVFVANSTLLQELGFRKEELLARLGALLPRDGITDIRFRLAPGP